MVAVGQEIIELLRLQQGHYNALKQAVEKQTAHIEATDIGRLTSGTFEVRGLMRKIRDVELTKPWMVRARDLFMLSFYLNGINFKDLSLAKHDQIYQGRLNFNRAKTGRSYSIKIFPEAQEIIDRYQGKKYLLRMIEDKEKRVRKKVRSGAFYKDITDYTNELLKIVAGEAKVPVPLSTYYARHSLASIARNIGISRDDIRAILGHGQDTVTDIYIDLDQERIDEAMRKVLDELKT